MVPGSSFLLMQTLAGSADGSSIWGSGTQVGTPACWGLSQHLGSEPAFFPSQIMIYKIKKKKESTTFTLEITHLVSHLSHQDNTESLWQDLEARNRGFQPTSRESLRMLAVMPVCVGVALRPQLSLSCLCPCLPAALGETLSQ